MRRAAEEVRAASRDWGESLGAARRIRLLGFILSAPLTLLVVQLLSAEQTPANYFSKLAASALLIHFANDVWHVVRPAYLTHSLIVAAVFARLSLEIDSLLCQKSCAG